MKASLEIDPQETPAEVLERVKTAASDRCHVACGRAKEMVTKNPIPTVFGALVFGAAVGYLVYSKREELSLSDRLAKEAGSLRHTLASGSKRLSSILHDGLDAASQRAHQASSYVHDLPADDVLQSVTHSLNRLCNRLKFW